MINIVRRESDALSEKVKEQIVLRLLASFVGKSLDKSYEGKESSFYTREENGNLLRAIKRFSPNNSFIIRQAWEAYINSILSKDIIELYHRKIINGLYGAQNEAVG